MGIVDTTTCQQPRSLPAAMFRSALVFSLLLGAALATPYQDCGSKGASVAFDADNCITPPCILKSGSKFPITINVTLSADVADLEADVFAVFGTTDVSWPGFDHQACNFLNTKCPPQVGQHHHLEIRRFRRSCISQ